MTLEACEQRKNEQLIETMTFIVKANTYVVIGIEANVLLYYYH